SAPVGSCRTVVPPSGLFAKESTVMDGDALEHAECKILCQAIQEALRHIDNGDLAAGYRCLMLGLERAHDFVDAGEAWAGDLADSYRAALFQVSKCYPGSKRVPMTQRPWLYPTSGQVSDPRPPG